MKPVSIEDVVKDLRDLPSLPSVILELIHTFGQQDVDNFQDVLLGVQHGVVRLPDELIDADGFKPLRVHADACVSAFVQKSNFEVRTNGPYPETGCFEPPYGH